MRPWPAFGHAVAAKKQAEPAVWMHREIKMKKGSAPGPGARINKAGLRQEG
jgi:hypothetical protein